MSDEYKEIKAPRWEILKRMEEGETLFTPWCGSFIHATEKDILANTQIYEKVEHPWYENLDGTIENGVICKVWDGPDILFYLDFIVEKHNKFISKDNTRWEHAEPIDLPTLQALFDSTKAALEANTDK